ncbi:RNA polymerase recycling motor ATPase HelR [uncultured Nocardioides sp.]|uniref:RNA polymerase recycling motor ATPase HelR n=1 Tax=uncultured Nocardioides sp. TaxID=198441 RepID=UPI00261F5A82|nr:RNA polymerase recycling motor ATPase HelR [uncultured Nocardioides sp.]
MNSFFALPAPRSAKSDPRLTRADEAHLAAIAACLERLDDELTHGLAEARRGPGGTGQSAMDRDQEVHRLTARLRLLRRFGVEACLGRMTAADGSATYVGRTGLLGADGTRLLVDWRTPAAEGFFAATRAEPRGLVARRRYRWVRGRVVDYSDEVLHGDPADLPDVSAATLDDDSALLAGLGESRTGRMRDVLTTIAADQDAIVRAQARGPLVVDGGPGTGKTVVALHRAAYLLHADPRLVGGGGGVLVVGPHAPYLAYVEDVLPGLGEESVATCTLDALVAEGATAGPETDPVAAGFKGSSALVEAIEPAVRLYEEPPTERLDVATPWGEVTLGRARWARAFAAPDPGTSHAEGREQVLDEVATIVGEEIGVGDLDGPDASAVGAVVRADPGLREVLGRAWPLLEATDLVGDLWEVPAYLRHCAPSLTEEERRALRRPGPQTWTTADLPLLDAARHRLGDPDAARRRRRAAATAARERARVNEAVDDLVSASRGDSGEEYGVGLVSMLRAEDGQSLLVDTDALDPAGGDRLAGPFGHVVVDEAQELTDAQWAMVLRRCPSRRLTVVGDRAQAREPFVGSWAERLARVGLPGADVRTLTVNYRTPAEIMEAAAPVIRAVVPDASVPTSVRSTGTPVLDVPLNDLRAWLEDWLATHAEGTACVVSPLSSPFDLPDSPRLRTLTPTLAKGLEFDLVVLVEGPGWDGAGGAVDRYVAMTRATQTLVLAGTAVT